MHVHTHRGTLTHAHTQPQSITHAYTHTHKFNRTLLRLSCFEASVVVFDPDPVVGSPQGLVLSSSVCSQDPASHVSAGVKGAPQALGPGESSLRTLVKVLTGWLVVRTECQHKSGEAWVVLSTQPPLDNPRSSWGASKMQMPRQMKRARTLLVKFL